MRHMHEKMYQGHKYLRNVHMDLGMRLYSNLGHVYPYLAYIIVTSLSSRIDVRNEIEERRGIANSVVCYPAIIGASLSKPET